MTFIEIKLDLKTEFPLLYALLQAYVVVVVVVVFGCLFHVSAQRMKA